MIFFREGFFAYIDFLCLATLEKNAERKKMNKILSIFM